MKRFLLLLMAILCSYISFSQTAALADVYMKNFVLNTSTSPYTYTFDITAVKTGGNWSLGTNNSFTVNFNSGAFFTSDPSYITLGTGPLLVGGTIGYTASGSFVNGSSLTINVNYSGVNGAQNPLSTETTIVRVTLYVANTNITSNLSWGTILMYKNQGQSAVHVTAYGSNDMPLPVKLTSFNATKLNANSIILNWSTATELNNKGFYIERSCNGVIWMNIGFIPSLAVNGNSQQMLQYAYTDENVFKLGAKNSTYYYRLRQQDLNGTEEFVGGMKSVRFGTTATDITYGPNPANNVLSIYNSTDENINAVIMDMSGRIATIQTVDTYGQVNLNQVQPGAYILLFKNASGETVATHKLFIKN